MITIIDYGIGNRGSIMTMLRRLGIPCRVSGDSDEIARADRLILPGVGAFDAGMSNLDARGLIASIHHAVRKRGTPLLGVCLGMQLMCERSEEGERPGLGLIAGTCVRFDPASAPGLKVPHMGWAAVDVTQPGALFLQDDRPRFYFAHSYYVVCRKREIVTAEAQHGVRFAAAIEDGNLFGVQFHPEKSHRFGMRLMQAFAQVPVCAPA
jgi:glutamine amidotransferase